MTEFREIGGGCCNEEAAVVDKLLAKALVRLQSSIEDGVDAELDQFDVALPTDEKTKRILSKIQFLEACASESFEHAAKSSVVPELTTSDYSHLDAQGSNQRSSRPKYCLNYRVLKVLFAVAASLVFVVATVHHIQAIRLAKVFWNDFEIAQKSDDLNGMYRALCGYVQCSRGDVRAESQLETLRQQIRLETDIESPIVLSTAVSDSSRLSRVSAERIPEPSAIELIIGFLICCRCCFRLSRINRGGT